MIRGRLLGNHSTFVKLLAFYFVCLVLGALNIGAVGSLLKVIAFLPACWWLLTKHAVSLSRPLVAAIGFLGFFTLSVLWSVDVPATMVGNVGSVSLLVLLCVVSGYRYNAQNLDFLKKALVWSSRITAIIILFSGWRLESRLTLGGILREDPNYLCAYYLFGVVYAVEMILSSAKHSHKLGYLVELGIYLALVIASGSRGGAVALAAALAVAAVGSLLQNKISIKTVVLPLLLISSLALTCVLAPYLLPQEVLQRFYVQEIVDSQGTGRYRIWQEYLHLFIKAPFWRQLVGFGNSVLSVLAEQQRLTTNHVAHNIFIEHLIGLGVVGLGLYVMMLWQFIRAVLRRKNMFALSVLAGMIVLSLSTSFGGKPYWNILIFIVCLSQFSPVPSVLPKEITYHD